MSLFSARDSAKHMVHAHEMIVSITMIVIIVTNPKIIFFKVRTADMCFTPQLWQKMATKRTFTANEVYKHELSKIVKQVLLSAPKDHVYLFLLQDLLVYPWNYLLMNLPLWSLSSAKSGKFYSS